MDDAMPDAENRWEPHTFMRVITAPYIWAACVAQLRRVRPSFYDRLPFRLHASYIRNYIIMKMKSKTGANPARFSPGVYMPVTFAEHIRLRPITTRTEYTSGSGSTYYQDHIAG